MTHLRRPRFLAAFVLVALAIAPGSAMAAGETMPTQPLICAATEVAQCTETKACAQGSASLFNLPVLMRVSIKNKVVESIREGGERRSSAIDSARLRDGVIVLRGSDADADWTATIRMASGKMTVIATKEGSAFVVFGSCTTL